MFSELYSRPNVQVRLLCNLVWEHYENQALVGELEGLALVLDCSQVILISHVIFYSQPNLNQINPNQPTSTPSSNTRWMPGTP